MNKINLRFGNCLDVLPEIDSDSVDAVVTSPPYFNKIDYGLGKNQLGLEDTPEEYCKRLAETFKEIYRVMSNGATLWIIIGDTYNNHSPIRKSISERKSNITVPYKNRRHLISGFREKELLGIPFMLKDYLREVGFIWRSLNIWYKPSFAYDSAQDRPTLNHEYIFQFVKSYGNGRPYANIDRIDGSVWSINPTNIKGHPCSFPLELAIKILNAVKGNTVLDPFMGAGVTGLACMQTNHDFIGIELNQDYFKIAEQLLTTLV